VAESDVVVCRVGMVTAVGLSAAETAASVQSATMRFAQIDCLDRRFEPITVASVPDAGLPVLSPEVANAPGLGARDGRLVRLGARALAECFGTARRLPTRPALILALPEPEREPRLDAADFLGLLAAQTAHAFDAASSTTVTVGRAGGLVAVGRAASLVRSGRSLFVLAGGVDSLVDPSTLSDLDTRGRVKSEGNLDGFIPGEGAAFLLLASRAAAAAAGLPAMAVVSEVTEGFEKGHLGSKETYKGEGLAATIQSLVSSAPPPRPFVSVWSSMNGESHWGREWGVALLRSSGAFADPLAMNHPADCFGDTGAAAGAILTGLACLGTSGGPALVYASSDLGPRASLSIRSTGGN